MTAFGYGLCLFLLANLAAGLLVVFRGRVEPIWMLGIQIFGTTGTAILLLLAELQQQPPLRDVALICALLAAVTLVGYAQRIWARPAGDEEEP
ncbi:MAG: monovalent cation/H+ antiporter complex subunit F [Kiritimatiellae bacterium]|nr:monovalent cation/H+ antiporter complex subunit F [Kiritimatiellia bacterium]MDW8457780.1 monovalent cation/H+ antiporter complex subunit F [Verrucomicrobiota bacterium]